ncbi:MAG: hypothetical protein NT019_01645 [Candidatus Adlerbacteria bacterium]|nr:hypothetical protein [Candidatus Adlerbacteria bacterium]
MEETPPVDVEIVEKQKPQPMGPMFAAVIVVLIFIVGGIYFLIKQEQRLRELKLQQQEVQLPANS